MSTPKPQHPWLQPKKKAPRKTVKLNGFIEMAKAFMEYKSAQLAPKTITNYQEGLNIFANYVKQVDNFSLGKASNITREMVQGWMFHMTGTERLAPGTVQMLFLIVRRCFSWCVLSGHLEKNPTDGITAPSAPPSSRDAFTDDEYKKLKVWALSAKWSYWYAGIVIGYHTGLRLQDVAKLKREHLDFSSEMIRLTPQKTKRHKVTVEIPMEQTELYPLLRQIIDNPDTTHYLHKDGYILPEMAAKALFDGHSTLSQEFTNIRKKAEVRTFGFHCLRHTFASRLINSGADCTVVASMTGHKDLNKLQRYAHVSADRKRAAILGAQNK